MEANQVVTILNTCFWICLVLTVVFLIISVILFFLFDIKKIFGIETGRAKAKTVKEMQAANQNTGRLRVEGKMQTSKLTRERIERGRAPAVIPPTEKTKKEFYQQNDEAKTEILAPQSNPEPSQFDLADSTPVFAETTVLSNRTEEPEIPAKTDEPAIGFRVVREVMLMHTNEMIPSL